MYSAPDTLALSEWVFCAHGDMTDSQQQSQSTREHMRLTSLTCWLGPMAAFRKECQQLEAAANENVHLHVLSQAKLMLRVSLC